MSKKLCFQWNDFQENLKGAFGNFRQDESFNDVTLVCEDGQQSDLGHFKSILPENISKKQAPSPTNIHERSEL